MCEKKIGELKEREQNASLMQDVETALIAGRAYLASGNPDLADESFAKVLSLDKDNPYAYLGILMIETGNRDMDSLEEYYINLYHDDVPQSMEACEIDHSHIDGIVDRYYLPGYFEKETIRRYYAFDRSYESVTDSRIEQKRLLHEEYEMNPLLSKIIEKKDETIAAFFERIEEAYDKRIRESKQEDQKHIDSIAHIYQIYLEETDRTLGKIYEERFKERNEELEERYAENIALYNDATEVEEFQDLQERFERDIDYRDNREYADRKSVV